MEKTTTALPYGKIIRRGCGQCFGDGALTVLRVFPSDVALAVFRRSMAYFEGRLQCLEGRGILPARASEQGNVIGLVSVYQRVR